MVMAVGKYDFKKILLALKDSILALMMPVIILGGIYSGLFTATKHTCSCCLRFNRRCVYLPLKLH